jgi:hypothetical protein
MDGRAFQCRRPAFQFGHAKARRCALMPLSHLEILIEEPSMEATLDRLLPKLIGNTTFRIYAHNSKETLLRRLPGRLKAYRQMLQPGWLILVLVDQDDDDCRELKNFLEREATAAGLMTRTGTTTGDFAVLNRIVIEELEAWYFGDWRAVRRAYPRVPPRIASRAAYRNPDAIKGGTWEAFERIMQQAGYFPRGLRKQQVAEQIAPHLDPARNTSRSFQVFRDALLQAAAA